MIREWCMRRYVEADYRYLEAHQLHWWDDQYMHRLYRHREFWHRLAGKRV